MVFCLFFPWLPFAPTRCPWCKTSTKHHAFPIRAFSVPIWAQEEEDHRDAHQLKVGVKGHHPGPEPLLQPCRSNRFASTSSESWLVREIDAGNEGSPRINKYMYCKKQLK